jgi:glycosyltransferase involved in cell wall biosynthesis
VRTDPANAFPSTVFGLTAYNGEQHLAEAIESLLTQTREDLTIVVVDDCSIDRTKQIALRYAQLDPRVTYERNERRLGLVGSWRRAFELACERFPSAPYYAWASDHDVWHPRWLETLAAELDAHPEAVLAYPLGIRIDEFGAEYPTRERPFDTAGASTPLERVRRTGRELTAAGEAIYGLARRAALARCGPYPLVVLADRLQLLRLSVEGEFRQVARRLWYRRYRTGVVMSNSRQRRASFPGGAPAFAYVPWWLTHPLLLVRSLRGHRQRWRLGAVVLFDSILHAHERRRRRVQRQRRWRRRARRLHYRGLVGAALQRVGLYDALRRRGQGDPEPAPSARAEPEGELRPVDALAALERAELLGSLAVPGAVVFGLGRRADAVAAELEARYPELLYVREDDPRTGSSPPAAGRVDLAVSVGRLEQLTENELEQVVRWLHELGVPTLYSLDRESASQRVALRRWYWLRDVWISRSRVGTAPPARKPDPLSGPVPRQVGRYRHLVGRRRLLPEEVLLHGREARITS